MASREHWVRLGDELNAWGEATDTFAARPTIQRHAHVAIVRKPRAAPSTIFRVHRLSGRGRGGRVHGPESTLKTV